MESFTTELLSDADILDYICDVYSIGFKDLERYGLPPPADFVYNPSRLEKDVHPHLLSTAWFRR